MIHICSLILGQLVEWAQDFTTGVMEARVKVVAGSSDLVEDVREF